MGRKTFQASSYRFTGLARGDYEVYAEAWIDPETGVARESAYERFILSGDRGVSLIGYPGGSVSVFGAPAGDAGQILLRRKDLAGVGPVLKLPGARNTGIPNGRWEAMLLPPTGYYASGLYADNNGRVRADGWIEIPSRGYARFTLNAGPGTLHGIVKSSGDPVPGAPVYLEGWDGVLKKRIGELRTTRTDMRGQYTFRELGPGGYRILSTFEYAAPDSTAMDSALAAEISVQAHGEAAKDLELYVIR
jgi:hypothetical protein